MAKIYVFFFLAILSLSVISSSIAFSRKLEEEKKAKIYEIKKHDFSVKVTNYGATILSVVVPDSSGNLGDVALGLEELSQYFNNSHYFGSLVGRVANRISNSSFVLEGKSYKVYPNEGKNCLHGGHRGFSHNFWRLEDMKNDDETINPYIKFYYRSFDGEQGFPGALDVYVTYNITANYELSVFMEARSINKTTVINLAQNTYWNLNGEGNGTILSHKIQIFGSEYTPVDENLIPTGDVLEVNNTAYDFLQPKFIEDQINEVRGYDINYIIDGDIEVLRKVAVVSGSGRKMELWGDRPGLQFYTGNSLKGVKGKNGHVYRQYGGMTLVTQGFPNSVNLQNFPDQIYNRGDVYKHHMIYKFSF